MQRQYVSRSFPHCIYVTLCPGTLRTLQPLLERINKLPVHERSKFRMPKTLKTIHAHAIELVYADHGADVVDYIHRAPATALPVIIPRLQVL